VPQSEITAEVFGYWEAKIRMVYYPKMKKPGIRCPATLMKRTIV